MIERNLNTKHSTRNNSSLPITADGYKTTTSTPNYQISGIEPNYSYNSAQNLPFYSGGISQDGFTKEKDLQNAVNDQQTYINNYNKFMPTSTFLNSENNTGKYENLRDFSQFNVKENFE